MLKRVLVALSGTSYTASAVHHAIELARAHRSELTGVTLLDLERLSEVGPVPVGGGSAARELAEHRIQITELGITNAIERFHRACESAELRGRVVREPGNPFDELTSLWRYHDLAIVGLQGLFKYDVVDDPDDDVARLIARGVRPILAVAHAYRAIERVLIAYNGSMESAKAMKRFMQMQLWPNAVIQIVCFDDSEDRARDLLHAAMNYCTLYGGAVEMTHRPGSARDGLLDHAAEWEADLIVMGSTNRNRITRLILGDTVRHLLHHADIPLFLTA